MPYSVFSTTDVQVHLVPIVGSFPCAKFLVIMRIHIAKEIPTAARVSWHGAGFPPCATRQLHPVVQIRQRTFALRTRSVFVYMWKLQWQVVFIHRRSDTIFPADRERFTPIALAAETRIAHFIIHLPS